MALFYNSLQESHLGYAAIFICVGMGFCFLRHVDKGEVGPGYWAISFFMSGIGFLLWSGAVPIAAWQYYLLGEISHVAGFFFLACGAYRFSGNEYKKWNIFFLLVWVMLWAFSILLLRPYESYAALAIKGLRAVLFISAGIITLRNSSKSRVSGSRLTGWSLIVWGAYIVSYGFLRIDSLRNLAFGFLVGFQVLAAFGMVVMVVERIRSRAEESEEHIKRLEGLLPVCSYCKKIRDKDDKWQTMELYIEEHSAAEFSHGICPECLEKHHPEFKA